MDSAAIDTTTESEIRNTIVSTDKDADGEQAEQSKIDAKFSGIQELQHNAITEAQTNHRIRWITLNNSNLLCQSLYDSSENAYYLIDGHHRYRAMK